MRTWTLEEDDEEQTDTWTTLKGGISTWLQSKRNSHGDRNERQSSMSVSKGVDRKHSATDRKLSQSERKLSTDRKSSGNDRKFSTNFNEV